MNVYRGKLLISHSLLEKSVFKKSFLAGINSIQYVPFRYSKSPTWYVRACFNDLCASDIISPEYNPISIYKSCLNSK